MSFWMKLGVQITDIECLKQSCRQHNIEYIENTDPNFRKNGQEVIAILRDKDPNGVRYYAREAYLVKDGGALKISVDNDPSYSSITNRLGKNGGKLTRDYATGVARKQVTRSGGFITSEVEQSDGSVVIRASIS